MFSFLSTALGRLRVIGFLEGASFLLLLGVAMPLKYFAGQPEAVRIVGTAHGALFLLYLAAAFLAASEYGWKLRITAALVLASFLPFGPFIADARLLRRMSA